MRFYFAFSLFAPATTCMFCLVDLLYNLSGFAARCLWTSLPSLAFFTAGLFFSFALSCLIAPFPRTALLGAWIVGGVGNLRLVVVFSHSLERHPIF